MRGSERRRIARGGGAAETAADDHDTRGSLGAGDERGGEQGGGGLKECAAGDTPSPTLPRFAGEGALNPLSREAGRVGEGVSAHYFCPAHHAAIATVSSWEKPLAIRSITVAGFVPERNASSAADDFAGVAPGQHRQRRHAAVAARAA